MLYTAGHLSSAIFSNSCNLDLSALSLTASILKVIPSVMGSSDTSKVFARGILNVPEVSIYFV